jgi:biotin operon repressor
MFRVLNLDDDYIVKRYSQWVPCWRIARELGVSRPTIEKRLRKRGVRIRTLKEYCQEKVKRGLRITDRLED